MKRMKKYLWVILLLVGVFFCPLGPTPASALDPGIYIADWGLDAVFFMDSSHNVSQFFPITGQVNAPYELEVDSGGNLIVSMIYDGLVYRISPDRAYEVIAQGLELPTGLAVDGEGNLYVAEAVGNIRRISPSGDMTLLISGLHSLEDLEFDSSGNLYATVSHVNANLIRISRSSLIGAEPIVPEYIDAGLGLEFPSGLDFYDGKLYVADTNHFRIAEVNVETLSSSTYYYPLEIMAQLPGGGTLFTGPMHIAFTEAGDVYISMVNEIYHLDVSKNLTTVATGFSRAEGILYVPAVQRTPIVTSLNPSQVIAGGSDFILTVQGANFMAGSVVQWNNSPRPTVFVSSTELTATISAVDIVAPGTANITVSNPPPSGGVSNSLPFSIISPVPRVTSLSPSSALAGGADFTLTVYGAGFVPGSVVLWNNSNRETTFISRSELRASIRAADIAIPGTANIAVLNPPPGGGLSNSLPFSIVSPAPNPVLSVTSLNPSSALAGGAGFTLTVTGTNFRQGSVVRWNGLNRPTIFVSNTQIQASISADDIADPGIMNINVFNPSPGGGSSNALPFRIKIATRVELFVDGFSTSSGTQYVKLKARVIDTLTGQTIYGIGYRYIYTYFYLDRRYIGMSRVNKSGTYAGYSVISYKAKTGAHLAKAVFNENEKYGGSEAEIQFTAP